MKTNKLKKGFSLPEVIIAVTLISLIIMTATNLLVSSIRANRSNVNQITAYHLAEEGIEAIRNIRDGYWMNNVKWTGEQDANLDRNLFGDEFGSEGYFIVGKKHNSYTSAECKANNDMDSINDPGLIKSYAPWVLSKIMAPGSEQTKLYLKDFGDVKEYTLSPTDEFSGFSRYIYIKPIPYKKYEFDKERNDLKISVSVTVEWEEQSMKKSITIPTILTDWKAGPF
jgi:prepilin-type N-terminal cleavage/methylation domain-containing protein